jgi:enamine deaminase RidA (YjgF/YER057c/UK114 family)
MPPVVSTPRTAPGSAVRLQPVNPPGWPQPKGYANGMTGRGRLVFVAGQIGWTAARDFATDDFVAQLDGALRNTVAVLAAAGARPEHVARMTWYVTDKREYLARLPEIGGVWRDIFGRHFPAMALVQVVALVEDRAKIEIETTALVPDEDEDDGGKRQDWKEMPQEQTR